MYFLSLEIENIRCFIDKQILDLSDRSGRPAPWTLLLGENGVGKTTILQCLTWMRTVEAPPVSNKGKQKKICKGNQVALKPIMDDEEDNTKINALIRLDSDVQASIKAMYSLDKNISKSNKKNKPIKIGMLLGRKNGMLATVEPEYACLPSFKTPVLFAYGANRHMGNLNMDDSLLKDPVYNLLSDSADLYDAEQILAALDYKALKERKGKADSMLDKVKELLVDLLPDIENKSCIKIGGPKGLFDDEALTGVIIKTPYGKVSLSSLSLGYKTMFAWAVDVAIRLLWEYPDSPSPLNESAIVIIDEIDLHLHPKWQRETREYLHKHFPNVQFICTAHSPFMVQASESENIAVLIRDGNHVKIENDPEIVRGWRIDQITTNMYGVSSRSRETELLLKERRNLLEINKRTKTQETRLRELDGLILELPTMENSADQEALNYIREYAKKLSMSRK